VTIDEIMAAASEWDGNYRQDFALVILESILDPDEPVDWDWIHEGKDEIAAMREAVAAGEALHVVPFLALVDTALQLSTEERRALHERLEQSLEDEPLDEETQRIVDRRMAEIESGAVKTIPADEVIKDAFAALERVRNNRR